MDLNKKFLVVNPDNTAGEYDTSKTFAVSRLQGIQGLDATSVRLAFLDNGHADDTLVDITVNSGKADAYIEELVNAINFGKAGFIVLADASDETSFSADVNFGTDPVITIGA